MAAIKEHFAGDHGFIIRKGNVVSIHMENFEKSLPLLQDSMWTPIVATNGFGASENAFLICTVFSETDKSISWLIFRFGTGSNGLHQSGTKDDQITLQARFCVRNDLSEVKQIYAFLHTLIKPRNIFYLYEKYWNFMLFFSNLLVERIYLECSSYSCRSCKSIYKIPSTEGPN